VRLAADLAERDDEPDRSEDEQPRIAMRCQQDARAQDQGDDEINQNCQGKFHGGNCMVFAARRKRADAGFPLVSARPDSSLLN